jgi:hypothetical protein
MFAAAGDVDDEYLDELERRAACFLTACANDSLLCVNSMACLWLQVTSMTSIWTSWRRLVYRSLFDTCASTAIATLITTYLLWYVQVTLMTSIWTSWRSVLLAFSRLVKVAAFCALTSLFFFVACAGDVDDEYLDELEKRAACFLAACANDSLLCANSMACLWLQVTSMTSIWTSWRRLAAARAAHAQDARRLWWQPQYNQQLAQQQLHAVLDGLQAVASVLRGTLLSVFAHHCY